MFMRFGVSNCLSIRDYQELSFVASRLKDPGADLIEVDGVEEKLLPTLLIYGANASGKSNVLASLRFLRFMVVDSHRGSPSAGVNRRPFRLDPECATAPTQIDCDIVVAGTRYHFGFKVDNERVLEEWLFAFPQGKRQRWYSRSGSDFTFGKFLKGQKDVIAEITRQNTLFLTIAAQANNAQLIPIYEYFESQMSAVWADPTTFSIDLDWLKLNFDHHALAFLRNADTGIKSHRISEKPLPQKQKMFFDKLKSLVSEEFPDSAEGDEDDFLDKRVELYLGHATKSGEDVYFDLYSESSGTIRLLNILGPLFESLKKSGLFMIDEIDSSLHALISRSILRIFASASTNPSGSQLLATTHDTSLLCSPDIRRDQIWFTEKDEYGATCLYPLTDIRTRNTDNLERGYLQGRFGAIPFIGPTNELLEEES